MIYFDHAATGRPSKAALDAFTDASREYFGNVDSPNLYSIRCLRKLEQEKAHILSLLGIEKTHDLLFTSGASEANNIAIGSVCLNYRNRGNKIITTNGEHSSVKNVFKEEGNNSIDPLFLPLDKDGELDLETLSSSLDKNTILCAFSSINNEVGSRLDLDSIRKALDAYPKAFLLLDATQSIGKESFPLDKADLISFSAHKFGGIKGVGALAYKKNVKLSPLMHGGSQQKGIRPGTVDLPSIISMGAALEESLAHQKENHEKVFSINAFLREGLSKMDEAIINSPENGSPYILNFSLRHKKASVVIEALGEKGIYLSSHSACEAKSNSTSATLDAMGIDKDLSENSIRLSLSGENTIEEAKTFLEEFKLICERIKDR